MFGYSAVLGTCDRRVASLANFLISLRILRVGSSTELSHGLFHCSYYFLLLVHILHTVYGRA